jgi:probable HAF family extracellular repeat protein
MTLIFKRTLVVAAGAVMAAGSWANSYVLVDLGLNESVTCVNRSAAVASNLSDLSKRRGQVYRHGQWRNLPPHSQVAAMNRTGDVVGEDMYWYSAMLWPRIGEPVKLPLPRGVQRGDAHAISDSLAVVGGYYDYSQRCFMWKSSSGSVDLGTLSEGDACVALSVNKYDQVTGAANVMPNSSDDHAFVWASGVFTDLGVPFRGDSATGTSINDNGVVVGNSYFGGHPTKAFMWNGSLVKLDPLNAFAASEANAINNLGQIVGWVKKSASSGPLAVRYNEEHRAVLLAEEVLNVEGWKLSTATSINDDGIIVGVGIYDHASHGYMILPQ